MILKTIGKRATYSYRNDSAVLNSAVHLLVVMKVLSAGHVVEPLAVVKIPSDSLFYSLGELKARLPAEFTLQFGRVDGVAHIVSLSVGDKCYQVIISTLRTTKQTVNSPDQNLDQIYVLPFIESADVVRLGDLSIMENQVYGLGVVLDIEPVAHVLPLTVDRQRAALTDVIDEQRDKLLRELVGAVVVRAVRHDDRHPVGVVVSPDEMVAGGLCG